jgi:hypothetical protein
VRTSGILPEHLNEHRLPARMAGVRPGRMPASQALSPTGSCNRRSDRRLKTPATFFAFSDEIASVTARPTTTTRIHVATAALHRGFQRRQKLIKRGKIHTAAQSASAFQPGQ